MNSNQDRSVRFLPAQLRHAYKHAPQFGILGGLNRSTLKAFELALKTHVASRQTLLREGSFRGRPVTHFVNLETGLNVMRDGNGEFLSAWKLSTLQLRHVLRSGKLGGG